MQPIPSYLGLNPARFQRIILTDSDEDSEDNHATVNDNFSLDEDIPLQ